jgi:hypothetical protein
MNGNQKRQQALRDLGVREDPGGLTEAIVRRVLTVPLARRYVLSDSGGRHSAQGLFLLVTAARPGPKGTPIPGIGTYWCQAPLGRGGPVKQVRIGRVLELDLHEARRRARLIRSTLRQGIDPVAQEKARLAADRARMSVRSSSGRLSTLRNRKAGDAERAVSSPSGIRSSTFGWIGL